MPKTAHSRIWDAPDPRTRAGDRHVLMDQGIRDDFADGHGGKQGRRIADDAALLRRRHYSADVVVHRDETGRIARGEVLALENRAGNKVTVDVSNEGFVVKPAVRNARKLSLPYSESALLKEITPAKAHADALANPLDVETGT